MVSKEKINRINFLANKSKLESLSEKEIIEQSDLRKEYIDSFKKSFKQQLDNIEIVDTE